MVRHCVYKGHNINKYIQCALLDSLSLKSILILSRLKPRPSKSLSSPGCMLNETFYAFLTSSTPPVIQNVSLVTLFLVWYFVELYELWRRSLCSFLHCPITYFLNVQIFPSAPSADTISLLCFHFT